MSTSYVGGERNSKINLIAKIIVFWGNYPGIYDDISSNPIHPYRTSLYYTELHCAALHCLAPQTTKTSDIPSPYSSTPSYPSWPAILATPVLYRSLVHAAH